LETQNKHDKNTLSFRSNRCLLLPEMHCLILGSLIWKLLLFQKHENVGGTKMIGRFLADKCI